MCRRFLLSTLVVALRAAQTGKPNILFVLVDDLGFNDMGWSQRQHGFEPSVLTPTIDSLAHEGVILGNYYVDTVCSPTRATIMTGRYPIHNTINDYIHVASAYGLPLNETTIAELIRQAGYATHAIGKWHLGYHKWEYTPTFRGFDSFLGYYEGAEDYFEHTRSNAYDLHLEVGSGCGANCSKVPDRRGEYSTDIFTSEAVRIIQEHGADETPWFMYLAYQSIHEPLQAPDFYRARYNTSHPSWPSWSQGQQTIACMLSALDDGIANISRALKSTGQYDNTLWILSTDNGGTGSSSNYPLRGMKHSIWEGGVKGAAFVYGAGLPSSVRGTVSHELMHAADWLPTLVLSVAGGSAQHTLPLDGVDQWQVLRGVAHTTRTEVVYAHEKHPTGFGLRQGKWKLLRGGGDGPSKWNRPGYGLIAPNSTTQFMNREQCNVTEGLCFPGADLKHVRHSTAEECCTLCTSTAGCVMFTFHHDNQKCFLKSNVGDGQANASCTSGSTSSPLPPTPSPPSPSPDAVLLFDLEQDPYEHSDVSAQQPEIVQKLLERIAEIDKTVVPMGRSDRSCPKRKPYVDPVVGDVWLPWCSGSEAQYV